MSFADLEPSTISDSNDHTERRASIYQILATAFYPPEKETSEHLWTNAISQWWQEKVDPVTLELIKLRLEYNRLFVGPRAPLCPPYESVYRRDRPASEYGMLMGPSVLDVKRRYAEAGLVISKNFDDLPDHVAVELEFMCFLCKKEVEFSSSEDNGVVWRERQSEFWKLHLKPWIGEFSDRLQKSTAFPFYKALATFLKDWIEEEGATVFQN